MALMPGTRFGAYEITDVIGSGGMGEVYRAVDTKLGRAVALKALPETFVDDPDRLARFEREAKTLATLNHPHIAHIYGLEEGVGARALIMELVEGEDLSQRLARGAIPVNEALRIASQIADAIEAAHEQGVIHRDLKPANIKVTPDGDVKVLDFGLAKSIAGSAGSTGSSGSGSAGSMAVTSPAMTQVGMILGTAAYMSPEQAQGRAADKRSDVWAFGCVLYEMLTGTRAFPGSDVVDTLAAVIRGEPDFKEWPADAPPTIKMLVKSCLTKDRRERASDIAAARYALRQASTDSTIALAPPVAARSREKWYAAAAAVLLVVAVALAAVLMGRGDELSAGSKPVLHLSLVPTEEFGYRSGGVDRDFAITPDGSALVYRVRSGLLAVRAFNSTQSRVLPGTENARGPFMSADGQWVGFWSSGSLRKAPLDGGLAETIAATSSAPRGHVWGTDGTIIFGTNAGEGLWRVPAAGGQPESLTSLTPGEQGHIFPSLMPDGQSVFFTILTGGVGQSKIAVLDLRTRDRRVLTADGAQAFFVEPGYLLFRSASALRAVQFDRDRGQTVGAPVTIIENIGGTTTGGANFDVARNGTLAYLSGMAAGADRVLVWADRNGRATPVAGPSRLYVFPRISPDGTRAVVDARDQEQDIWIAATSRGTLTRLSFGPSLDAYPIWTPDGRSVLFASSRDGALAVFRQAADGTGVTQRVMPGVAGEGIPLSVSPDGRSVVVRKGGDLVLMKMDGSAAPEVLMQTPAVELNADISPDGRWLAFDSNESGKAEVFVRPFPKVNDGRWQISPSGGSRPAWARNGKELYYEDAVGSITMVLVESGAGFSSGPPRKIIEMPSSFMGTTTGRTWDPAPDGRFLMISDPVVGAIPTSPPFGIVLNVVEELKQKLSPPR